MTQMFENFIEQRECASKLDTTAQCMCSGRRGGRREEGRGGEGRGGEGRGGICNFKRLNYV